MNRGAFFFSTLLSSAAALGLVACEEGNPPPMTPTRSSAEPSAAGASTGVEELIARLRADALAAEDGGADASTHPRAGRPPPAPGSDEASVAQLRPQFRRCYNAGLAADPAMGGTTVFLVEIAADGAVASVAPTEQVGLSPEVVACIADAIRAGHFSPGDGGSRRLRMPVKFMIGMPGDAGAGTRAAPPHSTP
jgi:hypothetical protein